MFDIPLQYKFPTPLFSLEFINKVSVTFYDGISYWFGFADCISVVIQYVPPSPS